MRSDTLPRYPIIRALSCLLLILAGLAFPAPTRADPADIAAAARGVVRVVIVGRDGAELFPISHGTGFAVTPEKIVTNAHVVTDLAAVAGLSIAIVPPEGGEAVPGKLLAYSPRNDLALIETVKPLRLPPLAIASVPPSDGAAVVSVGYPMNVDRAQGLTIADVFRAQPPVKSNGFLSGERPSRSFDTILHTAPIARGNSGGPLLDNCGRVVGVNSFGAETQDADGEFYFAVSARELLPFLRENQITPAVAGLPCRSLAEIDAEERERAETEARRAMELAARQEAERTQMREEARRKATLAVFAERENGMALAGLLLAATLVAGAFCMQARAGRDDRRMKIAGGIAALALLGMLTAWFTRPGMEAIEERAVAALKDAPRSPARAAAAGGDGAQADSGTMICAFDVRRSRITSTEIADVPFRWNRNGCVNQRTQYGLSGGQWSRVLVPNDEDSVTVARYDPEKREYRTERYFLGRAAMDAVRQERGKYQAPACGGGASSAQTLGEQQAAILAMLPQQPNERAVYSCRAQAD